MEWKFRSDLPIYSQLVEQIKLAIVSGVFAPGMRLSSVRDMAAEAGVNPNTLQRALQELERQGLVYSQRTTGRFVTDRYASTYTSLRYTVAGIGIVLALEWIGRRWARKSADTP